MSKLVATKPYMSDCHFYLITLESPFRRGKPVCGWCGEPCGIHARLEPDEYVLKDYEDSTPQPIKREQGR